MIKMILIPIVERKVLLITPPHNALKAARRYRMGRNLITMIKEDPPEKCQACCYQDEEKPRYVLFFNTAKDMGTIVHETDHVVKHMMKLLGAQQEQEFHAYTKEWLFNTVKKALARSKIKKA